MLYLIGPNTAVFLDNQHHLIDLTLNVHLVSQTAEKFRQGNRSQFAKVSTSLPRLPLPDDLYSSQKHQFQSHQSSKFQQFPLLQYPVKENKDKLVFKSGINLQEKD